MPEEGATKQSYVFVHNTCLILFWFFVDFYFVIFSNLSNIFTSTSGSGANMNIYRTVPRMLNRLFCPMTLQQRFLFEQTRAGSIEMEQKKKEMRRSKGTELERLKKGVQNFKKETKWMWQRYKDAIFLMMSSDNKRFFFKDKELVKFWDFNQANNGKLSSYRLDYKNDKFNDMNNWYTTCDSDFDVGMFTFNLQ